MNLKKKQMSKIFKQIALQSEEHSLNLKKIKRNFDDNLLFSKKIMNFVSYINEKDNAEQAHPARKGSGKNNFNQLYIKEMTRHSLLSEEEEVAVIENMETNEAKILEKIIKTRLFVKTLMDSFRFKYEKKKFSDKIKLKRLVIKRVKKVLAKGELLAIKREFRISRADVLKVANRIILKTAKKDLKESLIQSVLKVEEMQERLINANLRLVVSVAKRYCRKNPANLFDLIQEGNLGLIKAVEMFYYHKGVRFAAYAKLWIKQSIIKILYENTHHIKIPLHFIDTIKKLDDFITNHIQENREYPSIEKIVEGTGLGRKKIVRIIHVVTKPLSLDTPVFYKDGMIELKDTIKDKNHNGPSFQVFQTVVTDNIRRLLEGLSERERNILVKRYGLDDGVQRTLDEVGYYFNLTRERIRQIERKALEKLKTTSKYNLCKKLMEGDIS